MQTAISRDASQSMASVALFAALAAVLGLIPKIDLSFGVPITVQTLGVMLAGCLLGPKRGLQAMLLFLAAVAAGLPLLAGGRGGLGAFIAPSGGYLVGFAVAAWSTGLFMRIFSQTTPLRTALGAFVASVAGGLVVLHACGIAGLMLLAKLPLKQALIADIVFVPGDMIKCVLCAVVVHTIVRAIPDWNIGRSPRHGMSNDQA